MATKSKPVAIKASESVVAGLVAKILGVAASDTLAQVLDAVREEIGDRMYSFISRDMLLYPWLADVPAQVMADKIGPLIEHVAGHDEEVMWVVKDSFRGGTGGIWLVTAGYVPPGPWRGLFNRFDIGDAHINVKALQLESCLR